MQGKGAGAGEGAEQSDDAQQPDPVFIINPGADDAERNDDADPLGRLVGVAFGGFVHAPIIAHTGPIGNPGLSAPGAALQGEGLQILHRCSPR